MTTEQRLALSKEMLQHARKSLVIAKVAFGVACLSLVFAVITFYFKVIAK